MTKDEALKLIKIELDGIANTQSEYDDGWWETSTGAEFGKERLQKVLKIVEALEQPAQEPVAWIEVTTHHEKYQTSKVILLDKGIGLPHDTPLYTHPAPSWQGLSADEIQSITWKVWGADALEPELDYARAIEQALKEKNHANNA